MMRFRQGLALFLLLLLLTKVCGQKAAGQKKGEFVHLGDLYAEVTILNVLQSLQPTAGQLEEMRKLARKTMQKPPPRKQIKVSEKLRKTLVSLRDALAAGEDEKADPLFRTFEELREKEEPEFDEIEITKQARIAAPELLRRLSARQVAMYLASVPDFPDPVEQLLEAMEQSRKWRGKEWQGLREDIAYQVGWLLGGLDSGEEERMREKASALLNRAHALDDKQYERQREQLEKEARSLLGKRGPTDILRHFMERVLAELLSSHRLEAVLGMWKRK